MMALEREIAYDIAGVHPGGRSEEEILQQEADEAQIEKSGLTAKGIAFPNMLLTEGDQAIQIDDEDRKTPTGVENHEMLHDLNSTNKTNSLLEFMEIES